MIGENIDEKYIREIIIWCYNLLMLKWNEFLQLYNEYGLVILLFVFFYAFFGSGIIIMIFMFVWDVSFREKIIKKLKSVKAKVYEYIR